jgi:hypothetical protein
MDRRIILHGTVDIAVLAKPEEYILKDVAPT